VEAEKYLRDAIKLAPEAEHQRLYEVLGDSLEWGDVALEAKQKALELWRASEKRDVCDGARLVRKYFFPARRYVQSNPLGYEVLKALWAEGLALAEQCGDQDVIWLMRAGEVFVYDRGFAGGSESLMPLCEEAVAHLEQSGNWPFINMLMDGMMGVAWRREDFQRSLELAQMRLALPDLPLIERCDVWTMWIMTCYLMGNYEQVISLTWEALASLRAGETAEGLVSVLNVAIWSAYSAGRWDEAEKMAEPLGAIREQAMQRVKKHVQIMGTYTPLYLIARARENQPQVDAYAAFIEQSGSDAKFYQAMRDDNLPQAEEVFTKNDSHVLLISIFNEQEAILPDEVLLENPLPEALLVRVKAISFALRDDDNERLAKAIDDAEAHGLVLHAARMRVILARRSGDYSQLERARKVFERLGDRRSLRRLEEVAEGVKSK
jgi:hypothetical protein